MSEATDTSAEAVEDTAVAVDTEHDAATTTEAEQDSSSDDTDTGEGRRSTNADAAKYRKRAQAAEAERDQLAERLTKMQRAEAERLAGQTLGKGADLWAGGVELGSLLDESGDLSTDLLEQAVTEVIAAHPHWRSHSAPPASTVTANGKIGGRDRRPSFVDAFRPRSD